MDLGQKIRALREQKGMTLEDLGNKVGVGKSTVRKWENGIIANMRRDKISKIADALDVEPSYLMGWKTESLHRLTLDDFYSSEDGHKLISSYLSLNEQGKKNLLDHCDLLLSSEKYRVELGPTVGQLYLFEGKYTEPYKKSEVINAAHERTDIQVTDEMRKYDDIMDDENF